VRIGKVAGIFKNTEFQRGTAWFQAWVWAWLAVGITLTALAAMLASFSHLFSYDYTLAQLPALSLAAGMVAAGLVYLNLYWIIGKSADLAPADRRRLLILIIAFGILMRGLLLWSEPALEDDYQRYLWDGAVVASGLSPYAQSPSQAAKAPAGSVLRKLVRQSAPVYERINHPMLKTIYPPVSEAAFALAHLIKPWSLLAWRVVCLAGEALTLWLLLLLLRETGRSPVWLALYWWNPVVVKELINSAHMEAILTPFILAAFYLAIKQRIFSATAALAMAMGAKLWPVMLAPLLWRQFLATASRGAKSQSSRTARSGAVLVSALLLVLMAVIWALPEYLGGFDQRSGLLAYAERWKTGSAIFPQIEMFTGWLLNFADLPAGWTPLAARALATAVIGLIVLALSWRPIKNPLDLMARGGLAIAALLLLAPSQFPWYAIWLIPFLCFMPSPGLLAITALIPLYYVSFHYIALDQKQTFSNSVVWFIWLPVWALLIGEICWRATSWRRRSDGAQASSASARPSKPGGRLT